MKSKLVIFGVIFLLVVALFVIVNESSKKPIPKPMTFELAQQQALDQQHIPNCLASHDQNIPAKELKDISSVVGSELTDLPQGMAYSLLFNTYNNKKVSGTIVYDGVGNNFNFEVLQKNSKWQLVSFDACIQRTK
jgi:hypothetical protein